MSRVMMALMAGEGEGDGGEGHWGIDGLVCSSYIGYPSTFVDDRRTTTCTYDFVSPCTGTSTPSPSPSPCSLRLRLASWFSWCRPACRPCMLALPACLAVLVTCPRGSFRLPSYADQRRLQHRSSARCSLGRDQLEDERGCEGCANTSIVLWKEECIAGMLSESITGGWTHGSLIIHWWAHYSTGTRYCQVQGAMALMTMRGSGRRTC